MSGKNIKNNNISVWTLPISGRRSWEALIDFQKSHNYAVIYIHEFKSSDIYGKYDSHYRPKKEILLENSVSLQPIHFHSGKDIIAT
jgi:hypothetical protein